jgi:glutamate synthase (NADPH/NADH) small chain
VQQGDIDAPPVTAEGKRVVIIGGGDTGADCLGTSHRQGAVSVHQFEILPRPPDTRAPSNPWPTWSNVFRVSSAHEEGGERVYSVNTECFLADDDGNVRALRAHEVEMVDGRFERIEGTDFELPCELVLLAMGFLGPEQEGLLQQLGVELDARGNVARDPAFMTNEPGVFACGDMGRGQSLIVWAIAEGRSCAAGVDTWLMGETLLPAPIGPSTRQLL